MPKNDDNSSTSVALAIVGHGASKGCGRCGEHEQVVQYKIPVSGKEPAAPETKKKKTGRPTKKAGSSDDREEVIYSCPKCWVAFIDGGPNCGEAQYEFSIQRGSRQIYLYEGWYYCTKFRPRVS